MVNPGGQGNNTYSTIAAALKAAKPGDAIDLMTGDYGDLAITGINQNGFITIEAATGQTPRFTKINIGGNQPASHWRLMGLTVSGFSTGLYANGSTAHKPLLAISNSDNIIVERNVVQSQAGEYAWQPEVSRIALPDAVSSGIGADQSFCLSIAGNKLSNLWDGLSVGGDQTGDHGKYLLVSENEIDNFAGDGIDHFASHVRIEHNRITNGHDICNNQCIHTDGIQGWNWHNTPGLVNTDVVIDGNADHRPDQAGPGFACRRSARHHDLRRSLGWCADFQQSGDYRYLARDHGVRARIICRSSTIPLQQPIPRAAHGSNMDRNDKIRRIRLTMSSSGTMSRRDMAVSQRDAAIHGVTIDHNLNLKSTDDFEDAFVKFDPEHFAYDLHPSKRSDAKGEGISRGRAGA